MLSTSAFAETAALIGEPARANMLAALLDGRALTATELARSAGITPQTGSLHLARLTQAGLLAVERQGRHRYHRLASVAVAQMLEGMMSVSAGLAAAGAGHPGRAPRVGPRDAAMRRARTCYDHLAGRLAVAMADRMSARGELDLSADGASLTTEGVIFLRQLGVDLGAASNRKGGQRMFCRPCLDWSERRPHIGGAVGTTLCNACLARGWIKRTPVSRAVAVTPAGKLALGRAFDLRADVWNDVTA